MKLRAIVFSFIFLMALLSCTSGNTDAINPVLSEIDKNCSKSAKKKLLKLPEYKVINFMNGNCKQLDDYWFMKNKYKKTLDFFYQKGIFIPSQMKQVLYLSYYNKLKNNPYQIDSLIYQVKKLRQNCSRCIKMDSTLTHLALQNYKKYKIGDTISIAFPLTYDKQSKKYITYQYYNESKLWKYSPKKDLLIYGIILNKKRVENNALIAFEVKVLNFNKKNVMFFTDELKKGSMINVDLRFANIIPKDIPQAKPL